VSHGRREMAQHPWREDDELERERKDAADEGDYTPVRVTYGPITTIVHRRELAEPAAPEQPKAGRLTGWLSSIKAALTTSPAPEAPASPQAAPEPEEAEEAPWIEGAALEAPEPREGASPWLNVSQAARYLGVSTHGIRAWRRRGTFPPACRLGRLPRWKAADLDRWLESRRERVRPATIAPSERIPRGKGMAT